MRAISMACESTFRAFLDTLPTQGKKITTMTAPIGAHIREVLPTMGNAMIDLGFIRICFCCRLCDAFCNDFPVASLMTRKFTVGTLHTSSIFEKFSAKCTTHDVVELLLNKLVAILLVDFFLLLTNSTLTT
jgi:hypothetical protein